MHVFPSQWKARLKGDVPRSMSYEGSGAFCCLFSGVPRAQLVRPSVLSRSAGLVQVLKQCFGLARPAATATNTGYLLLYDCGE